MLFGVKMGRNYQEAVLCTPDIASNDSSPKYDPMSSVLMAFILYSFRQQALFIRWNKSFMPGVMAHAYHFCDTCLKTHLSYFIGSLLSNYLKWM